MKGVGLCSTVNARPCELHLDIGARPRSLPAPSQPLRFRDRTWPVVPRDRTRRIVVVRDSMVEGFLANRERTIPAAIEHTLQSGGIVAEVLNLGVAADLPEYLRLIRDALPVFRPGHVVPVFYVNDLFHSPSE